MAGTCGVPVAPRSGNGMPSGTTARLREVSQPAPALPPTYLDLAIADGHATIDTPGVWPRITSNAVNRTEYFADPEEAVRAEFWAELMYRYGLPTARRTSPHRESP
jgi:hypothetical protein